MDKRYPLAYLLEASCGLSPSNKNLNRWKALLRKSSVPIILDSGSWLIKEIDFENFLKGREHCFKLYKQKVVHTIRSKELSKYPMEVSELDNLQELLIAKKQKTWQSKSTEGL